MIRGTRGVVPELHDEQGTAVTCCPVPPSRLPVYPPESSLREVSSTYPAYPPLRFPLGHFHSPHSSVLIFGLNIYSAFLFLIFVRTTVFQFLA